MGYESGDVGICQVAAGGNDWLGDRAVGDAVSAADGGGVGCVRCGRRGRWRIHGRRDSDWEIGLGRKAWEIDGAD